MLSFMKSKLGIAIIVALLGTGFGFWLHAHFTPTPISTALVSGTPQIKVESPTLNPTTIDRVVTDPKQQEAINRLTKENNALNLRLTQVNSTTATNTSSGGTGQGGTVVQVEANHVQGIPNVPVQASEFKDFQLDAKYTTDSFNYTLNQSFRIVSSVSKAADGSQIGLVKLFQDTPKGLVEIPTTTTVIFADPLAPRFIFSPRVQAGLAFNPSKGGIVTLQWFKRGASPAAEDVKWAFMSPAIFFNGAGVTPVILPFSYNFGSIKHNPLTNLWISPTLDRSGKLGITFTATF